MDGLRYPGNRLVLKGRLRPASAGSLTLKVGARDWHVHIKQGGTTGLLLPTDRLGRHRARLVLGPHAGYKGLTVRKHYRILAPALSTGAHGNAVLALERRLARLRHLVRGGPNGYYAYDTYEAGSPSRRCTGWPVPAGCHATSGACSRGEGSQGARSKGQPRRDSKTLQALPVAERRDRPHRHVSTGRPGTPPWTSSTSTASPGPERSRNYYSLFFYGRVRHPRLLTPCRPIRRHGCSAPRCGTRPASMTARQ